MHVGFQIVCFNLSLLLPFIGVRMSRSPWGKILSQLLVLEHGVVSVFLLSLFRPWVSLLFHVCSTSSPVQFHRVCSLGLNDGPSMLLKFPPLFFSGTQVGRISAEFVEAPIWPSLILLWTSRGQGGVVEKCLLKGPLGPSVLADSLASWSSKLRHPPRSQAVCSFFVSCFDPLHVVHLYKGNPPVSCIDWRA